MTKREALMRLRRVAEALPGDRLLKLLQHAYNVQAETPSDLEVSGRRQHKQLEVEGLIAGGHVLEAGRTEREP